MNKIKSVIIALCIFLLMFSAYGCKKDNKFPAGIMNNNDSDFELSLASSSFDYENAFTSRDMSAEYDENIYNIQLEDNKILCDNQKCVIDKNVITITNTGTYVIKGELSDGQIIVDADSTDKIQIVLNNVSINNNSSSAIKIVQAKKVFVTLAEKSSNILSSPNEFAKTETDKADGVIYSKEKLTLNGSGKLSVKSQYAHGIVCNDDLVITDGEYIVEAEKHSIKAKDSICFDGGVLELNCGKDAVHCDNDEDSSKGNIYIKNTELSINAEDDAVHASGFIIIDDGKINAHSCYEGIEAQKIEINGGSISVKSTDDGINASSNTIKDETQTEQQTQQGKDNPFDGDENCYIFISGGSIVIDADGDGIDSNGYLLQSGGDIIVYGPENSGNSALDYDLQAKITGGTIVAFGFSGMAQGYNSYSTQGTMLISFDEEASGKFVLNDSDDNEIISCESEKKYDCAVVSTPNIIVGNKYVAKSGNQSKTIEMESISYSDKNMQKDNDKAGGRPDSPPSDMSDMSDKSRFNEPPEKRESSDFK